MTADLFDPDRGEQREPAAPKEPLFSLLCSSPRASIVFLLERLQSYHDDAALNDQFPEVGLSRREYIEQVMLALNARHGR